MASMKDVYLEEIAGRGAEVIDYIGLVDDEGNELSGGDYERKPVTWDVESDGTIRPTEDITFSIPGGTTVGGWRGYDSSDGGTDYGGADLDEETFTNDGEYTLLSDETGILHNSS